MNTRFQQFLVLSLVFTLAPAAVEGRGRGRGNSGGSDDDGISSGATDSPGATGTGGVDGSSAGGSGGTAQQVRSRTALVAPAGAIDPDAKGRIEVRSKDRRERLTVQIERIDPGATVVFLLENETGELDEIGVETTSATGEARLRFDTRKGGLPLGASTLADLAGRDVEVRTASGGILLTGELPERDPVPGPAAQTRVRLRGRLANVDRAFAPEGKAKVKLESSPARGRNKLTLEVEDVPAGADLEVFIRDPGGEFVRVAELAAGADGSAELELSTNDGDALPLGATAIAELFGAETEVRSPGGEVRFTGALPSP